MNRTLPTGLFGAALLLGLAANAWAKPKGIQIDAVMDDALLIAEVEVLEVHPVDPNNTQANSAAKVRVTEDMARVFKGFAWMGRTLQVTSDSGGAVTFAGSMENARKKKQTLLLVVRKDRSAALSGVRDGTGGEEAYTFNGWFDWNAVIVHSADKTFGERSEKRPFGDFRVRTKQLRERYAKEAQVFRARGAAWLLVQPSAPSEALAAEIAKLDSEEFADREDATKALIARGEAVLPALVSARQRAVSQEARTRLEEVLDANLEASAAYRWSQRVKGKGARAEAALLLESAEAPAVQPEPLARRLRELAQSEKLPMPEGADLDTLQAAWNKALAAEGSALVQPEKAD